MTATATWDPAQETLVVGQAPAVQMDPAADVMILERGQDYLTVRYRAASANLLRVAILARSERHTERECQGNLDRRVPREDITVRVVLDADLGIEPS